MPEPINGNAVITIDEKFLTAHVVVNEPQFGGHPYTYEMLCDELIMKGIRYNVFHDSLKEIFEKKQNVEKETLQQRFQRHETENSASFLFPAFDAKPGRPMAGPVNIRSSQ